MTKERRFNGLAQSKDTSDDLGKMYQYKFERSLEMLAQDRTSIVLRHFRPVFGTDWNDRMANFVVRTTDEREYGFYVTGSRPNGPRRHELRRGGIITFLMRDDDGEIKSHEVIANEIVRKINHKKTS